MKLNKFYFLATLAISFFTIGLVLSNLINEIFPACDFKKQDRNLVIECVGQMVLIYLLYFLFNKKVVGAIEIIFNNFSKYKLDSISKIVILISFSTGVYRHLDELNKKTKYLKNKYF